MSASLVGSEMCIRDRPGPHGYQHMGQGASRSFLCLTTVLPPAGPPPLPVSYTHLTLPTICSV
eukprot:4928351-Alexandrium_andersonii.AAC.1